jgi:polysaccharide export outer membrane protein
MVRFAGATADGWRCSGGRCSAGSGDILKITVYGNPDLATETRVSDAGTITFPLLGPVEIGGLTAISAEKKLGGLLESGGFCVKHKSVS